MLKDIRETYGNAYVRFALAHSVRHRNEVLALPLPAEVAARYERMAEDSLAAQREIEAKDHVPFETYRQSYLSHGLQIG